MKHQTWLILSTKNIILPSVAIKIKTMKTKILHWLFDDHFEIKMLVILSILLVLDWLLDPNYNNY